MLFKLITYKIIEEMRKTEGIKILGPKITCLFYVDDGIILAKEKAERSIEIVIRKNRRKVWPPTKRTKKPMHPIYYEGEM